VKFLRYDMASEHMVGSLSRGGQDWGCIRIRDLRKPPICTKSRAEYVTLGLRVEKRVLSDELAHDNYCYDADIITVRLL